MVNFIDLQLMGPYKRYRASYRRGIKGIEQASVQMFGHRFTELSPESQDEVLKGARTGRRGGRSLEGIFPRKISSPSFSAIRCKAFTVTPGTAEIAGE